MQISKSSWHYRFTDTFLGGFAGKCARGQHTTCSYIRAVFYAIVACLLSVAFFGTLAIFAVGLISAMIAVPVLIFGFPLVHIPDPVIMMAFMGWMFVAAGLFVATLNYAIKHGSAWSERRHSLMIQAMQDKKDGVCTLVQIVD
jgi:hypothetical protein